MCIDLVNSLQARIAELSQSKWGNKDRNRIMGIVCDNLGKLNEEIDKLGHLDSALSFKVQSITNKVREELSFKKSGAITRVYHSVVGSKEQKALKKHIKELSQEIDSKVITKSAAVLLKEDAFCALDGLHLSPQDKLALLSTIIQKSRGKPNSLFIIQKALEKTASMEPFFEGISLIKEVYRLAIEELLVLARDADENLAINAIETALLLLGKTRVFEDDNVCIQNLFDLLPLQNAISRKKTIILSRIIEKTGPCVGNSLEIIKVSIEKMNAVLVSSSRSYDVSYVESGYEIAFTKLSFLAEGGNQEDVVSIVETMLYTLKISHLPGGDGERIETAFTVLKSQNLGAEAYLTVLSRVLEGVGSHVENSALIVQKAVSEMRFLLDDNFEAEDREVVLDRVRNGCEVAFTELFSMAERSGVEGVLYVVETMYSILSNVTYADELFEEETVHSALASLLEVIAKEESKVDAALSRIFEKEGSLGVLKVLDNQSSSSLVNSYIADAAIRLLSTQTIDVKIEFLSHWILGVISENAAEEFIEVKKQIRAFVVLEKAGAMNITQVSSLKEMDALLTEILDEMEGGDSEELLKICDRVSVAVLGVLEGNLGKRGVLRTSELDTLKIAIESKARKIATNCAKFRQSQVFAKEDCPAWSRKLLYENRIEEAFSIACKNNNPTQKAHMLVALALAGEMNRVRESIRFLKRYEHIALKDVLDQESDSEDVRELKAFLAFFISEEVEEVEFSLDSEENSSLGDEINSADSLASQEVVSPGFLMKESIDEKFSPKFYQLFSELLGSIDVRAWDELPSKNGDKVRSSPRGVADRESEVSEDGSLRYLLSMQREITHVVSLDLAKRVANYDRMTGLVGASKKKAFDIGFSALTKMGGAKIHIPEELELVISKDLGVTSLVFPERLNRIAIQMPEVQGGILGGLVKKFNIPPSSYIEKIEYLLENGQEVVRVHIVNKGGIPVLVRKIKL